MEYKTVKIIAKGNGTNGRIIIKASKYYKSIPAVLFSPQASKNLLEIVDKIENKHR